MAAADLQRREVIPPPGQTQAPTGPYLVWPTRLAKGDIEMKGAGSAVRPPANVDYLGYANSSESDELAPRRV